MQRRPKGPRDRPSVSRASVDASSKSVATRILFNVTMCTSLAAGSAGSLQDGARSVPGNTAAHSCVFRESNGTFSEVSSPDPRIIPRSFRKNSHP